ncbi:hypothetical protein MTBPR1_210017 [Candidatus Terasakiella magnetica]|uniref:Uncharacterized protein n=1 Tax=Candidatus Terasakiella magnetica TaxID=1867952 RepID=A0A1C3RH05_9PROT|nr:hypothetical protein [Candidatus Terasakiella magnetica]SCA56565.1 hypothetical protein MTBPR1_210017 [Candidatus Terasakiella magnetica]
MSIFTQKVTNDVLSVTHKFVNFIEVGTRNSAPKNKKIRQQYMECELASSRLILYANNLLNNLASGQMSKDKRSFYIDTANVNKCCEVLEKSPLYYKHQVFADIVNTIKRLQRVNRPPKVSPFGGHSFSLSG